MVEAGYKYRIKDPSPALRTYLAQTFGYVRVVYNKALEARKLAYNSTGKGLSYGQTSALLTSWKAQPEYRWLNDVSCVPLQQSLRHLNTAYSRFFKKLGADRFISGYPSFKSKNRTQSAEFTKSGFRFLPGDGFSQPQVFLAKLKEPLPIIWSRDLPSAPTTITISHDRAGRYFIAFRVRLKPAKPESTGSAVGLDLGLTHAVITSEGEKVENPRYYRSMLKKLKAEQRKLSRKAKGSNNRAKQRLKVARLADMRRDWSHKLTTDLVRRYDLVAIESLNVKGMVKNHSLALSIADVSWGEIKQQLRYKASWYGKQLVEIDQWAPTSKTCSGCGYKAKSLPLRIRDWVCPSCGSVHDRDVNAAKNVLAEGHSVAEQSFGKASGLRVRPTPLAA